MRVSLSVAVKVRGNHVDSPAVDEDNHDTLFFQNEEAQITMTGVGVDVAGAKLDPVWFFHLTTVPLAAAVNSTKEAVSWV